MAELEGRREEDYRKASYKYSRTCAENERSFREKRGAFDDLIHSHKSSLENAFRDRKPLDLIKAAAKLSLTAIFSRPRRPIDPSVPVKAEADRNEIIWQKGMEGETAVHERMAQCLDDSWTCLQGFHGVKGEIDFVLIGPDGIAAIEVKNLNGRISCHGNKWTRDKYDAYGNVVDFGLGIADKGGRSRSRQLLDSAHCLASSLGSHSGIYTIVVLSHDRCRVHQVEDLEINELVHLRDWDVAGMVKRIAHPMTGVEISATIKSIKRLHMKNASFRKK